MTHKRLIGWLGFATLVGAGAALVATGRHPLVAQRLGLLPRYTVASRLEQLGTEARSRLHPYFTQIAVQYPGRELILVGLKAERRLDVYVRGGDSVIHFLRSYDVKAASGGLGPKLREGDRQVPEGLYQLESLNPNSRFHLALRVAYPNMADRRRAVAEGRTALGGDIMIHGGHASIGCLAMGDPVIEELFVLAADIGRERIRVILAPQDLRVRPVVNLPPGAPSWSDQLYAELRQALEALPPPSVRRAA